MLCPLVSRCHCCVISACTVSACCVVMPACCTAQQVSLLCYLSVYSLSVLCRHVGVLHGSAGVTVVLSQRVQSQRVVPSCRRVARLSRRHCCVISACTVSACCVVMPACCTAQQVSLLCYLSVYSLSVLCRHAGVLHGSAGVTVVLSQRVQSQRVVSSCRRVARLSRCHCCVISACTVSACCVVMPACCTAQQVSLLCYLSVYSLSVLCRHAGVLHGSAGVTVVLSQRVQSQRVVSSCRRVARLSRCHCCVISACTVSACCVVMPACCTAQQVSLLCYLSVYSLSVLCRHAGVLHGSAGVTVVLSQRIVSSCRRVARLSRCYCCVISACTVSACCVVMPACCTAQQASLLCYLSVLCRHAGVLHGSAGVTVVLSQRVQSQRVVSSCRRVARLSRRHCCVISAYCVVMPACCTAQQVLLLCYLSVYSLSVLCRHAGVLHGSAGVTVVLSQRVQSQRVVSSCRRVARLSRCHCCVISACTVSACCVVMPACCTAQQVSLLCYLSVYSLSVLCRHAGVLHGSAGVTVVLSQRVQSQRVVSSCRRVARLSRCHCCVISACTVSACCIVMPACCTAQQVSRVVLSQRVQSQRVVSSCRRVARLSRCHCCVISACTVSACCVVMPACCTAQQASLLCYLSVYSLSVLCRHAGVLHGSAGVTVVLSQRIVSSCRRVARLSRCYCCVISACTVSACCVVMPACCTAQQASLLCYLSVYSLSVLCRHQPACCTAQQASLLCYLSVLCRHAGVLHGSAGVTVAVKHQSSSRTDLILTVESLEASVRRSEADYQLVIKQSTRHQRAKVRQSTWHQRAKVRQSTRHQWAKVRQSTWHQRAKVRQSTRHRRPRSDNPPDTNGPRSDNPPGTNGPRSDSLPGTNGPRSDNPPGTNTPRSDNPPGTNGPRSDNPPDTGGPRSDNPPDTGGPRSDNPPGTNAPRSDGRRSRRSAGAVFCAFVNSSGSLFHAVMLLF